MSFWLFMWKLHQNRMWLKKKIFAEYSRFWTSPGRRTRTAPCLRLESATTWPNWWLWTPRGETDKQVPVHAGTDSSSVSTDIINSIPKELKSCFSESNITKNHREMYELPRRLFLSSMWNSHVRFVCLTGRRLSAVRSSSPTWWRRNMFPPWSTRSPADIFAAVPSLAVRRWCPHSAHTNTHTHKHTLSYILCSDWALAIIIFSCCFCTDTHGPICLHVSPLLLKSL